MKNSVQVRTASMLAGMVLAGVFNGSQLVERTKVSWTYFRWAADFFIKSVLSVSWKRHAESLGGVQS